MPYTWLLFDADNTLFDYDQAEVSALRKTLEQFDIPFESHSLPTYQRINKKLWHDVELGLITPPVLGVRRFELLAAELQLDLVPETLSATYLDHLGTCSELVEGAIEMFQELHPHYRFAIVTNGLKVVQRSRLAASPIREFIAEMVISEEVGATKPHQAIFDVTFERIGNPGKHEVLMIGDSLTSDMTGGHRYGIDTCWFNPTSQPPPADLNITYQIKNLADLGQLLRD